MSRYSDRVVLLPQGGDDAIRVAIDDVLFRPAAGVEPVVHLARRDDRQPGDPALALEDFGRIRLRSSNTML